ncbi:MAG: hypothetical protein ACR2MN_16925 [Acidimicrobiales bacterium]
MGTPASTSSGSLAPTSADAFEAQEARNAGGPLAEIDEIVAGVSQRDRQATERGMHEMEVQREFLDEFTTTCRREIRPAMESVLRQLHRSGGGGLIEEHNGGETRIRTPRLTLWMSLEGDIVGGPRPDRDPYLQLDADAAQRDVKITEGDMWRGAGAGHSGPTAVWQLSDITAERITQELADIVRRAAL